MDLRVYYQKIKDIAQSLPDPCVVVSNETPDGGRAGVLTEVSRQLAARMIIDGRARPASEQEAGEFREQTVQAKRAAEQLAAASRMQLTVVPTSELRNLKKA